MNILLIGCGNIGSILLNSWLKTQSIQRVLVVQPSLVSAAAYCEAAAVTFVNSLSNVPKDFKEDVTVLAIKPQQLHDALPHIKQRTVARFVSVLAATPLEQFTGSLPENTKVFRLMPNIAMRTGKSINLIVAAQNTSIDDVSCLHELFAATGNIIWLDNEQELDNLTLIASSGLAYFLLLGELLSQEAIQLGVAADMAANIVRETIIGAASLVEQDVNFNALIDNVASKKGITAAALAVLRPKMQAALEEGIQVALKRGEEMQRENSR